MKNEQIKSKRMRHVASSVIILGASIIATTATAHAVVVRGKVTDPLGAVVIGAKVQLIQGTSAIALSRTDTDGTFEIRSTAKGRFRLLTSAATFAPAISDDFYGGVTDVVAQNVVVEISSLSESVTVTATGIPTPIQQSSAAVSLISAQDLVTRLGVSDELRQAPGVDVVQTGQTGGVTTLFVRGGNSTANKVLIDGITAEDVGGTFDFGTVSPTGVASIETYRGPNSVLYGSDAGASVVFFNTPRGEAIRPTVVVTADGGNFDTYHGEAEISGARQRIDYYAAFGRFDTSNALPLDVFRSATSSANLGYTISPAIQARFTIRNADSRIGLPDAHDFFGISNNGAQYDQDLYSGLTLESRINDSRWHNLARYGITRKREQARQYPYEGTAVTFTDPGPPPFSFTEYFGNVVTIRGANGYSATGQTSFFGSNTDSVSNRDELYFQSDYAFSRRFTALLGFRYEKERGRFVDSDFGTDHTSKRTNFKYTLQFQGDIKNRFFYSAGGAVEKNHLYGIAGTPRIGLAYVPVRIDNRRFRGTKLRASAATGVQEPTLALEFASLYDAILTNQDKPSLYNVTKAAAQRSRSYDVGVDQNILGERLIFKAGYFHNVFDHQLEGVDYNGLNHYFGIPATLANPNGGIYEAYTNSLAFRAQGAEAEIEWQAMKHLFVHGGYTYLDAVVKQSLAADAANAQNGAPTVNPNLPDIPIGALSPLVGARPFRRPPHSGFFAVQYTDKRFAAAIKGALASRSDDSTFLDFTDFNGGNTLLLPNRNLDFGYAKLDASVSFVASHHLTVYSQVDNLLNQQHIGPIGFPALPLSVRGGIKYRFGGA